VASAFPFYSADQALPWLGLSTALAPAGTSHRWDSGPAGHVVRGSSNTSSGSVGSSGVYTGVYPKTYTITITQSGSVGTARFSWSATNPPGGGASNLLTAPSVPLDDGISATFANGTAGTSFVAGDTFSIIVRPDLRQPQIPLLASRLADGRAVCSTCHDQHSQAMQPFDPQAPPYGGAGTGNGRHYQRSDNDRAQMCEDCHAARVVTAASQGSHPVNLTVPSTGSYKAPSSLPLDATGKVRCLTCHTVHYAPTADGSLLRQGNHNQLCQDCHTLAGAGSPAHLSPTSGVLWPGGQYGSLLPAITASNRRGYCTNCHQPHGWPDASSPTQDYPWLLADKEENFCYTCHDGNPVAGDVRADFNKTYRHPAPNYANRHNPRESGSAAFGTANRHAECTDCHNPHQAVHQTTAPTAPTLPPRLAGVSGVAVTNGAAGTMPSYTFVTTAQYEYQVCFKCHSSFTTQPAGQSNLAVKFNPNNPSYHPVEAPGKNTPINAGAFVNGWNATKQTYCSDCHASDTTTRRGPHGSAYQYILKKSYNPSSATRTMSSSELCFDCHNYNTYANPNAGNTVLGYSRFNPPNWTKGHAFHVGSKRYPCGACHETHGSSSQPHLIVTGRNPGLNNYTHSASGGTCYPTCHGSKTYTVNY